MVRTEDSFRSGVDTTLSELTGVGWGGQWRTCGSVEAQGVDVPPQVIQPRCRTSCCAGKEMSGKCSGNHLR